MECKGLLIKMRLANEHGIGVGPPLHDGLFVEKLTGRQKLLDFAQLSSREVSEAMGAQIEVELKDIPSAPLDDAF